VHCLSSYTRTTFRHFIRKPGCCPTSRPLALAPLVLVSAILLLAAISGCGGATLNPNVAPRTATASSSPSASASSTDGAVDPVTSAPQVSLLTFGNAGFGGDDTTSFQNALNNTAANGQALLIPAGSYNISPIFFPNNSQLVLAAGVTVTANPGYGPLDKMLNITSQNVSIQGAGAASVIFQMRKSEYVAEHSTDNSEWRHCLDIEGASNVTISGISCNQSGGDGIYVADGAAGPSQNVTISNSVFDQNFRQGFSLISGVHIFVSNCYFTNTSGTAPEAGIDIEPNTPNNTVADVHITNNFSTGNAGAGLLISLEELNGSSPSVDVSVSNYQSASNQLSGYELINNDVSPNVQGNILIQNSSSTNDGSYGAVGHGFDADGPTVVFQNLSINDPHKNGPDPTYGDSAAVGCLRGGGGSYPIGNIQFQAVSIAVTNGMVNRYFNFQDYSNIGVQKMVFNPTALSGASLVPPDGLMQAAGFNSVD
jgi:hypothetical protein